MRHVLNESICFQYLGNVINIVSGEWVSGMSGIGAGMDSLYEYLLKVRKKVIGMASYSR